MGGKKWIRHQTPSSFVLAGLKVTRETVLITRANNDIYSPWNSLRAKRGPSTPAACSTASDVPMKQINMLIRTPDEKTGNGPNSVESEWNSVSDESTGFPIENTDFIRVKEALGWVQLFVSSIFRPPVCSGGARILPFFLDLISACRCLLEKP